MTAMPAAVESWTFEMKQKKPVGLSRVQGLGLRVSWRYTRTSSEPYKRL